MLEPKISHQVVYFKLPASYNFPDNALAHIEVHTRISVWDLQKGQWMQTAPVIYRNHLLGALHPQKLIVIGAINPDIVKKAANPKEGIAEAAKYLAGFRLKSRVNQDLVLDFASNSRSHGQFFYTLKGVELGAHYIADGADKWKRIVYGSLCMTTCKRLNLFPSKFVVTDDTKPIDDPVHDIEWDTGDSHGKVDSTVSLLLNLGEQIDTADQAIELAYQFRLGIHAKLSNKMVGQRQVGILAKGTVANNSLMDMNSLGVDSAYPLSSFKAYKPTLGEIVDCPKLIVGTVFESELRQSDPNWQFLQWFSWDDLQQEGLVADVEQKAIRLRDAVSDAKEIARLLRIEAFSEYDNYDESQGMMTEVGYVSDAMRIIANDKFGLLLTHPYLVRRIKEHTQEMWKRLLRTATIKFHSLMCQPDESLPMAKDANGKIIEKVCCAKSLPEGEYIVFCSPTRHWGDIQVWENRHIGAYTNVQGVVAVRTELASTMGRDFDGDFVSLIEASKYPHLASVIKGWSEPPTTVKFPKVAIKGTLAEIAASQMQTLTGITALLLAQAVDLGASVYNAEVMIPPGGEDKEPQYPKLMKIIDFLSQQVQISVDAPKSAYPNNEPGIKEVQRFIERQAQGAHGGEGAAAWWFGIKDPDVYLYEPCPTNSTSNTLMNRMAQFINVFWQASTLAEGVPENFQATLFGSVTAPKWVENEAEALRNEWRRQFASIAAITDRMESPAAERTRSLMIRQVVAFFRERKEDLLSMEDPLTNEYASERQWAAAVWRIAHTAKTGSAGLPFVIFADEIIRELLDTPEPANQFRVIATQHSPLSPTAPAQLDKAPFQTRMIIGDWFNYKQKRLLQCLPMGVDATDSSAPWQTLGVVNPEDTFTYATGSVHSSVISSFRWNPPDGKTSSVWVFPATTHPQVIKETLWIQGLMLPHAHKGAWGPLPGQPWVWQGQEISANHNNWRWDGQIFNIRCLPNGDIEAQSPSATKLIGYHFMGTPTNSSLRALWRGAELPMKAYSVRVDRTRHEISLFSADMPDDKCRRFLGI